METDTTLSLAGPSESIILDDKPVSPSIDWYKFWPIPGFSAAYGVHQYFRRHRPRRLPVLTPMRPLELYIALCFTYILVYDNVEREMEVIDDKDLLTIELAGRLARRAMLSNPNFRSKFEHFHRKVLDPDDELNETFRKMREVRYHGAGFGGKLTWWHTHVWSDQKTWNEWATFTIIGSPRSMWPRGVQDWDAVITHIANSSSDADHGSTALKAFGSSVPVAMLARWTRRSLIVRPINGLQRLLFGAWIYCDFMRDHYHWANLFQVQDRHQWAVALSHAFGDFEEEIAYAQRVKEIP